MERMHHGISFLDWLTDQIMIILLWEIEHWLFGKDKDIIISQHAIYQAKLMLSRM